MTTQRTTLHFVAASSRLRAELARVAYDLGHHAEVYTDHQELLRHPPRDGIVLVDDDRTEGGVPHMLAHLATQGLWLPVVALGHDPDVTTIVTAMKAGALDYLPLPLAPARLEDTLNNVAEEAEAFGKARRRMIEARGRLSALSGREREVLDWLSRGSSNKNIARELDISPRTVEIHRANMMSKLGASHAADAVRLRLEAQLEDVQEA